ncbi:MAG: hypothetical protein H6Q54_1533 [Deltaproteobacteria bacterium]|nr:hypothetical protein [Deltaproteobacteria bacterium]
MTRRAMSWERSLIDSPGTKSLHGKGEPYEFVKKSRGHAQDETVYNGKVMTYQVKFNISFKYRT